MTLDQRISEFYVEQRLALYMHLQFMGVPNGEAQELTQEAFLALYRAVRHDEAIENWRAWVYRVARNLALNRHKASDRNESLDNLEKEITGKELDPEKRAMISQRNQRLFRAIASLSPQQRECLHLRASGLRHREIAEILKIKLPTVGEFLRRGIAHLKKAGL